MNTLLFTATFLLILCQYSLSIVISTSFGRLNGRRNGEFHSFKYIPFAKPPLGELRFQKPEPPEKWVGVRDAKDYGPACMSNSTISKSPQKWVDEDCLHVNIFTSDKCLYTKNCAVVIYLHGGDILYDSAVMFNDTYMFDTFVKNDVILVVPAFRLGIFSHFTVRDQSIAPTNIGIYDMLQAMEFTKSEIHNFGGNNKKITLFGHSYGGTVISMLTFSTEVNKDLSLFQQVIPMSSHQYIQTLEEHMVKTQKFAEFANCLPSQTLEMTENERDTYTMKCLQAKSAQELLRVQRALEETGYPTLGTVAWREPLFPKGKRSELMDFPKQIPMLTGSTRIEFDHEPEPIDIPLVLGLDNPVECNTKYRKDLEDGRFDRGNHTDKTQMVLVPTMMRVRKLRENGIPAYLYEYSYPKHARHTDDLFYIMGVHPFEMDENEVHLQKVYQEMFTNFAKFGHPGNGFDMTDLKSSTYLDINWNETSGLRPKMRPNYEKKLMDYWLTEMIEYDKSLTELKRKQMGSQSLRALISPSSEQRSYFFFSIFIMSLVFLTVIVSTSSGKLSGKQIGEYHLFKKIPFAKPPIGKLRFQKPENPEKWRGVRDATEYGPACMSNSTETSSIQKWIDEDCLHLNIFTSSKCLESRDCAVVVYIHGGQLIYDSAVMFNDTFVLDAFVKNDVVLVIPAFRLGIFSHFTVEDQRIAPTNVALLDILKSLEFLKTEIDNFGGSNQKVSLLGHSFGGTIAAMFTFSKNVNRDLSLFQKTVVMSAYHAFQSMDFNIEKTRYFAEHANCSFQEDRFMMECLQEKDAQELLRVQRSLEESGYHTYGGVIQHEPIFPEVKSSEFMKYPKNIPMLTGCTKFEFDHAPGEVPVAEDFGFENPDECEAKYRQDLKEGTFDRDNHTDRTLTVFVSTKMRVDKLAQEGIPAYLYQLRYSKHIAHTDDLFYIMGVHPFDMDENEIHLKDVYQNMVMNFVKSGDPGNGFKISNSKISSYFEINWNDTTGVRPKMSNGFEKKVMDYWGTEMMKFDQKITAEKKKGLRKTPTVRLSEFSVESPRNYQKSHVFFVASVLLLVFLLGYFFGKTFSRRNLYIQLDGDDHESVKNI